MTDVLLSGAGAIGARSEARQMASIWYGDGVRLWLDEQSVDSAENAEAALGWARSLGATGLIVVSSWWHLRLLIYYRGQRREWPVVRHVRSRRTRHVFRHLKHELRYLSRALRGRPRLAARHGAVQANGEELRPPTCWTLERLLDACLSDDLWAERGSRMDESAP